MIIKSQFIPICLSLLAAFIGAFAQYLYKKAAMLMGVAPLYKNYFLLLGLVCFSLVLVLFLIAFKQGGRLFVIYPVYATTYIWVGLIGVYLENEPWSWTQMGGVGLIMSGVALLGLGSPT